MKIWTILSVVLIYSFSLLSIIAQNKYKTLNNSDIVEYRMKDGLPSNNFTSTVQTQDGYLWFSGPEGTFRFDGYEFNYIGEEYGIPEMQSVFYDSNSNMLYFASPEKFASFDGTNFQTYDNLDGYKLNENQGQVISFVKGDSKGRIWVGSYTPFTDKEFNGSLIHFNKGKFKLYDSLSFPLYNAKSFIETPFGDLIFTSYGKNTQNGDGAYIALYKHDSFTKIDDSFGFNYYNAIPNDNYSSHIDSKGNTWIPFIGNLDVVNDEKSIGSGVLVYDGDSFKDFPGLNQDLGNKITIADLFCDNKNNKIYVNIFRYESKKISSSDIQIYELQNNRWKPSSIIKQIFKASGNDKSNSLDFKYNVSRFIKSRKEPDVALVFSTGGIAQSSTDPTQYFAKYNGEWKKIDAYNGLPILDIKNSTVLSTSKGIGFLTPSNSKMLQKDDGVLLPEINISTAYSDRRGLVWFSNSYSEIPSYITLNNSGMNVWDGSNLRKVTVEDGLKSNVAFNIHQDNDMNVWVPTDKGITQIRELQNSNGEWIFRLKNIEAKNQKDYNTTTVIETKNSELFVYQNYVRPDYGIVPKADFFLGKIVKDEVVEIKSPFSAELQKQAYQLYFLREDSKGQLWLEGLFANSVENLSSVKTELKIFTGSEWIDPPTEWNVPKEQLHFVGELDNGAYYLTAGHFYNFNRKEFIDLSDSTDEFADYRILKGASVTGTFTNIQSGEYLYIRLRGRGLVIFDGKKLKYLTPRNSILPTDIHNPSLDYFGNLFFGSHAGVVRLRGEKINLYFDDEKIREGGPGGASIDMNGNIVKFYVGIGIAVEKHKTESDTLRITSITINDKPYYYKFPNELSYSENSLLFNYSVLNFSSPDQTMYEYVLEGYDKEWSRSSSLSFAEYQNLPPGKYLFRVKATVTNNKKANESSFTFIITPPIWKTWWAYICYVLVILALLYLLRRFEINRQKKNNKIKESRHRAEAAELQTKVAETQARAIQAENDRQSKELEEARQLQLSLLPKELPKLPNLEIAVYMQTATEVGGDYYDFSTKEDGSLNIAIGDATGHGMKAGTLVSMIKSLFTANSINKGIIEFFKSTNVALKKTNMERMMMGFAMLNIKGSNAELINAGLPSIYHFIKGENKIDELNIHSLPLGAMSGDNYSVTQIKLGKGDVLLMMTDGFPELMNSEKEMFGYNRAIELFEKVSEETPDSIITKLKTAASDWVEGNDPDDDVTFVVIKTK